ncbi:MAG TPA: pyridoxamine 5'-phosphate oxidase family protein [Acidimicrobiales bacterium]|nr:pyridoxamine 5'-phosphate oxidase family protein [Acidimicrobiales bacterium]
MSIRLSPDEAWEALAQAHTGIFTTLRRDGMPIALPVWFVAIDRTICLAAPSRTKKLARLRHDPRASFLIESGERWVDLLAVHLTGRCELLDLDKDRALIERIDDELDVKYAKYRGDHTAMPQKTQEHYAARTFIRFVPDTRVLTWDNSRMPMKGA